MSKKGTHFYYMGAKRVLCLMLKQGVMFIRRGKNSKISRQISKIVIKFQHKGQVSYNTGTTFQNKGGDLYKAEKKEV